MWLWELEHEDTNTKMLFLGYIQYFSSCKINVSPSKSWTLRSKKNDCYPICWQSVCELFSQQCGEISSWPLLMRIGPWTTLQCNVQFAMSQAPSLFVIDGFRSFSECFVVPCNNVNPAEFCRYICLNFLGISALGKKTIASKTNKWCAVPYQRYQILWVLQELSR